MSDNKYKLFRNFMVNELGVSREDIKEWTMQAVRETVEKELRSVNVRSMAHDIARKELKGVYDYGYQRDVIRAAIGDIVRKSLSISVGLKEENDGNKQAN